MDRLKQKVREEDFHDDEKVSGDLAKNRDYLDRQLGVGESFDVLYRNVEIGKKNAALYMIDGFCKDEVMQKLLQHFIGITKEQMPEDAAEMSRQLVPYGEVDLCDDLDEICRQVMSGVTALLLEGYEQGILIDARTYPARSVGEPERIRCCAVRRTVLWKPLSLTRR